jgi:cytochrome c oxidase assembly protein subunit 15
MTIELERQAQNRTVAYWLLLCCGLVFIMVVLGGFTRLTGSGLSMVDWRRRATYGRCRMAACF